MVVGEMEAKTLRKAEESRKEEVGEGKGRREENKLIRVHWSSRSMCPIGQLHHCTFPS